MSAESIRRDALLEAAALCDRMADGALEGAGDESVGAYGRVALEEAASQLVAARDRLRAMADEPFNDDGEVPS